MTENNILQQIYLHLSEGDIGRNVEKDLTTLEGAIKKMSTTQNFKEKCNLFFETAKKVDITNSTSRHYWNEFSRYFYSQISLVG